MQVTELREALARIRLEFTEMPEMKLTLAQVRRLMNLPAEACEAALAALVASGFLVEEQDGTYLRGAARSATLRTSLHAR